MRSAHIQMLTAHVSRWHNCSGQPNTYSVVTPAGSTTNRCPTTQRTTRPDSPILNSPRAKHGTAKCCSNKIGKGDGAFGRNTHKQKSERQRALAARKALKRCLVRADPVELRPEDLEPGDGTKDKSVAASEPHKYEHAESDVAEPTLESPQQECDEDTATTKRFASPVWR